MKLQYVLSAVLFVAAFSAYGLADDKADAAASQAVEKKLAEIKPKEDDANALNAFFGREFGQIFNALRSNKAQDAVKQIDELEAVVAKLEPKSAGAKQMKSRAEQVIKSARSQAEIALYTVDELKKKIKDDPKNASNVNMFAMKIARDAMGLTSSDPKKAEATLQSAKDFIASLEIEEAETKKLQGVLSRQFAPLASRIASAKKLLELVGKKATELKVDAWVNGSALTDEDLKGKVVLLDFWAVWCGPCIATFPHLREWQEKYGEKDFVMIGLTRYYNYKWNDETNRASRSREKVAHDDEHVMLEKFAGQHKIHHRIGVQTTSDMSKYYGVSGIPHVVVIDKQGVVRMVKVGSGPANAKAISELLEELVNG